MDERPKEDRVDPFGVNEAYLDMIIEATSRTVWAMQKVYTGEDPGPMPEGWRPPPPPPTKYCEHCGQVIEEEYDDE